MAVRRISALDAASELASEGTRARYPDRADPRYREPLLFPEIRPSFSIEPGEKIFTIGSCFARNVEEHLNDFELPTRSIAVPKTEFEGPRPNGILNVYNPGTIAQRITRAMHGDAAPRETIVPAATKGHVVDLLLRGNPVAEERAHERRREIDSIYAELPSSDVVILTLGLAEAWYDRELGLYLNRMPPRHTHESGRYELLVLSADEVLSLLGPAFSLLEGKRVILTVSPVPFAATFSGEDAIVANAYSKAVLRIAAEELARRPGVDYFPSYEIALSGGTPAYADDNVHVLDEIVGKIVACMLDAYVPAPASHAGLSRFRQRGRALARHPQAEDGARGSGARP